MQTATFGTWLKARRKALDLTRVQLASQVGCAEITLEKIERDQRRPSKQIAELLASALQVPAEARDPFVQFARGVGEPPTLDGNEPRATSARSQAPTNLPAPLTSFVGRRQETAEVRRVLGLTRLLTLTGAGGCGKTRLAQHIATDMRIAYNEGVWYAELATLADPALIIDAVARALGLFAMDRPAREQVLNYLRERQVLLVLDNCEHLIDAVAAFAVEVLHACPRVTILTTSREALNVYGETTWRVPPMQPDEAGQLFVDRAAAARADVTLSAQDQTVAHICQRLDGIPLAIELAATRLSALSLSDIATRLEDRFALLIGGRRGVLPRQQTLRALIDWSYDALSEQEKIVFRRVSVFVSGWALEQAEQVVADSSDVSKLNVLSVLAQLIAKSLLMIDSREGMTRYSYLETIREYAQEKLVEYAELETMRRRHAEAYAVLCEQSVIPLHGGGQKVWVNRLKHEYANLQVAMKRSFVEQGDHMVGLRIVASLTYFWAISIGNFEEVCHWYFQAMQTLSDATPQTIHAALLNGAILLNVDIKQALIQPKLSRVALKLSQQANDESGMALALCLLGSWHLDLGQFSEGESYIKQGIALAQEIADDWVVRVGLSYLIDGLYVQGELEKASILNERVLKLCRDAEDFNGASRALLNQTTLAMDAHQFAKSLDYAKEAEMVAAIIGDNCYGPEAKMRIAQATYYLGDSELALSILEECIALAERLGHEIDAPINLKARVMNALGDYQGAQQLLNQQLSVGLKTLGMGHHVGENIDFMACVAITRGDMKQGACLFGAGEAAYIAISSIRMARHEWEFAPYMAKARAVLGDAAYEAAYTKGRELSLDEAIALAMID